MKKTVLSFYLVTPAVMPLIFWAFAGQMVDHLSGIIRMTGILMMLEFTLG